MRRLCLEWPELVLSWHGKVVATLSPVDIQLGFISLAFPSCSEAHVIPDWGI